MMNKKLNEFKSSIITELIKNMELLIQSEFQNIIQEHKNQLEEVSSTVAMLQQHVTSLKQKNLNLQEKSRKDQQDLEKYCKENATTKSWKRLSVCLVRQVSMSQMPALIVQNRVSRTNETVKVRFTPHYFVTAICFTGKERN